MNLGAGNAASLGAAATVGVRDAGGLAGNRQIAWSYDAPVLSDSSAILFAPPATTQTSVNTITTVPAGLTVSIDGVASTTPKVVSWTVGTSHSLAVSSPQVLGGVRATFAAWSTGSGPSVNVVAQTGGATYTATFTSEYQLTTSVLPVGAGTVSGAGWYPAASTATAKATAGGGYRFYNWSGDASGTANPTTITMSAPRAATANFVAVPSSVTLGRSSLRFGAISGGAVITPGQDVVVSASTPTTAWTAVSDRPWLQVTPASGSGSGKITISLVGASLPASGSATATITVAMPSVPGSTLTINCSVTVMASGRAPYGSFDTPAAGATVASSIPVTGWALDDIGISNVRIWRDPVSPEAAGTLIYIGDAVFVPDARPDVETANPTAPLGYRSGWGYMLLTNMLPNHGNGSFKLHAIATNVQGQQTTLASKTVTGDNLHASKPFGAIDTPAQGATVSGSAFVNFGWALTPGTAKIPVDGSTMVVYVDGAPLGQVVYNSARSDIDTLFPGYTNTGGAVGHLYIDTTLMSNGMHSIAWSVTDNQARADGIGSRYFFVLNSASASSAPRPRRLAPLPSRPWSAPATAPRPPCGRSARCGWSNWSASNSGCPPPLRARPGAEPRSSTANCGRCRSARCWTMPAASSPGNSARAIWAITNCCSPPARGPSGCRYTSEPGDSVRSSDGGPGERITIIGEC